VPSCPSCGADLADEAGLCSTCAAGGEAEPPPLELAAFGRRFAALVIDALTVLIPLGLLVNALGGNGVTSTTRLDAAGRRTVHYQANGGRLLAVTLLEILIAGLYAVLMKRSPAQATVGQMATGLQVVDLSGHRIGLRQAIVRYLVTLLTIVTLGVGGLAMLASRYRQTLQDLIARTLVVRKPF
jgi:uncharacterized RDD family membrane protein YckC